MGWISRSPLPQSSFPMITSSGRWKGRPVRHGNWKLVLNGQLVEGEPPQDRVHLANLDEDMGETANLKDEFPHITAHLHKEAEALARASKNAGHLTGGKGKTGPPVMSLKISHWLMRARKQYRVC